jgi:isocitrate dehydrogenase
VRKESKGQSDAAALDKAVGSFLTANKNPSRKVMEIDNRGSHYWVARYWADELAKQDDDAALKAAFGAASKSLGDDEAKILEELIQCQGKAVDLGGYYRVDKAKTDVAMNPSATLNGIIATLAGK